MDQVLVSETINIVSNVFQFGIGMLNLTNYGKILNYLFTNKCTITGWLYLKTAKILPLKLFPFSNSEKVKYL